MCVAQSGATRTPVIELYTSEGCSSCPPADRWLSSLKAMPATAAGPAAVVQAFHVGYWDYIGWVDRFASPAHIARQREVAARNLQRSLYTPQAVLDGKDWRAGWQDERRIPSARAPAGASIHLQQLGPDQFEATVTPTTDAPAQWAAYWTLTEHGHSSKVSAGENKGERLLHDYVVRQYTPAGNYRSSPSGMAQKLVWRSIPATPGHPRQINLVVFDPQTGTPLQAVSAAC